MHFFELAFVHGCLLKLSQFSTYGTLCSAMVMACSSSSCHGGFGPSSSSSSFELSTRKSRRRFFGRRTWDSPSSSASSSAPSSSERSTMPKRFAWRRCRKISSARSSGSIIVSLALTVRFSAASASSSSVPTFCTMNESSLGSDDSAATACEKMSDRLNGRRSKAVFKRYAPRGLQGLLCGSAISCIKQQAHMQHTIHT